MGLFSQIGELYNVKVLLGGGVLIYFILFNWLAFIYINTPLVRPQHFPVVLLVRSFEYHIRVM